MVVTDATVVSGVHAELRCVASLAMTMDYKTADQSALFREANVFNWQVTDVSSNGTFVNGVRMRKGVARDLIVNDVITLGSDKHEGSVSYQFMIFDK